MLQDKDKKAYLIQALAVAIPWGILKVIDAIYYRNLTADNFFFYLLLFWFVSSIFQLFGKESDYRRKWMPWLTAAIILASIISIRVYQPKYTVNQMREKAEAEGFVETAEPPVGTIMWIPDPDEPQDNFRLAYLFEGEKDGEPCYLVANPYFGYLRFDNTVDSITAKAVKLFEEQEANK